MRGSVPIHMMVTVCSLSPWWCGADVNDCLRWMYFSVMVGLLPHPAIFQSSPNHNVHCITLYLYYTEVRIECGLGTRQICQFMVYLLGRLVWPPSISNRFTSDQNLVWPITTLDLIWGGFNTITSQFTFHGPLETGADLISGCAVAYLYIQYRYMYIPTLCIL